MPSTSFTVGQAAERTGLSVHTLRFYEKEGLFATPVRRVGGQRVYSENDLRRLHLWPGTCPTEEQPLT
ncbi:MerR family DNA-binding transcriptional regulator [Nonomuraea fuscirosea]|uniref:MerR family DNA-binding transcriptional regulator n=1 Tax=Nonomuraea fuscirosea TaxID=1291556 RepID=UPI002DD87D6C|nr:MerR family DNA-binding transcriptional regulator [Nonomuraea fuscirosea]WSA55795.1 MerR family DNA-binding transcriptional regulator [Nonomuraea fuscirosea]